MKLCGYIRVSRVGGRGGESFISPDVQRQRIEDAAARRGHQVVAWFTDLDVTGGKMSRPEFDKALQMCRDGRADGLAVAKLDRFARSLSGALECIQQLGDAGAVLLSAQDDIDASTPNGKLQLHILLTLAQWERDRIAAEWRTSRTEAVGRGVAIASLVPFGYDRGDDGRLVPNSDAQLVAEAFQRRAAGDQVAAIGRSLGKSPQATNYLLRNRTYLGEVRSGDLVQQDAHPAIVDVATFEAAQRAKRTASPRNDTGGMLLAGLVRCAQCRYVLAGRTSSGGRYSCRCEGCKSVSVKAPDLEGIVTATVAARLVAPVIVGRHGNPRQLEAQLAEAEAELAAYVGVMRATDPGFRAGYDQRAQAVDDLRAQLAATVLPTDAADAMDSDDITTQRAALTRQLQAVFVAPGDADLADRVAVVFADDAPVELPKRGNQGNSLPAFDLVAA